MSTHKSHYDILIRPMITEEALKKQEGGQYTFQVARDANKREIKAAVQAIYNVRVKAVNTVSREGKIKRVRFKAGRQAGIKKAYIQLAEGQSLSFT